MEWTLARAGLWEVALVNRGKHQAAALTACQLPGACTICISPMTLLPTGHCCCISCVQAAPAAAAAAAAATLMLITSHWRHSHLCMHLVIRSALPPVKRLAFMHASCHQISTSRRSPIQHENHCVCPPLTEELRFSDAHIFLI